MTPIDPFERHLPDGLADLANPHVPSYLNDILADTGRARQRPAWSFLERWLPMALIERRPATAPPLRAAWVLLLTLLLAVAVAGSALLAGARLLTSMLPTNDQHAAVAIPQGGAAVLAFDSNGDVFTVRADGSDLRQLTSGDDIEGNPAWSPDGTRIAYRLWQDNQEPGGAPSSEPISFNCTARGCYAKDSIAVMDAGGGHQTILATTGQPNACLGPRWDPAAAWSPDGSSLIYSAGPACDGNFDLFIVASDGSTPATKLLAPGLHSYTPAWSPDGRHIAFQGRDATTGAAGLYVADVGATGALAGGLTARQVSAAGQLVGNDGSWTTPTWSPDGTEIASAAGTGSGCDPTAPGTLDIYIFKADGSGQRLLANTQADEYNPTWGPDGRRIAFQRAVDAPEVRDGQTCSAATWVIDAGGSNERRLDSPVVDGTQLPFWSPDGTRLLTNFVVVTPGDNPEPNTLYVTTVDGSSPVVSIDAPTHIGLATWQPLAVPLPPAPSFGALAAP